MRPSEGSRAILERLRREERAAWGVDPDGTAYIDVAERLEQVRAAYIAQLAEEEREADEAREVEVHHPEAGEDEVREREIAR